MLFIPSNRDDITRYYRGTYIKLKDYGDKLFYVEGVDSLRVVGKCENGDPFCIYMDDDTPYQVDYILPHKSFFQLGPDAVQLQRIPAKQYYRGLCPSNVQLVYMKSDCVMKKHELNFGNLKEFVNKKPFSSLRAALSSENVTTALSPRMMFHRQRREIYIDFTPVAKVNPGKLTVFMNKPIFMDEIKEMMHAGGDDVNFKVEVYQPPPPKEKTKTEDLLREMGEKKANAPSTAAKKQPATFQLPQGPVQFMALDPEIHHGDLE